MNKVSHFIDGKIYTVNDSRKGPIFNPALLNTSCNFLTYPNDTICLSVTINNDVIDPKIFIISGSSFKLPLPICKYLGTQTRTLSLLIKHFPFFYHS